MSPGLKANLQLDFVRFKELERELVLEIHRFSFCIEISPYNKNFPG